MTIDPNGVLRGAALVAAVVTAPVVIAGGLLSGWTAALAVVVGAGLMGLAVATLARGLSGMLAASTPGGRARVLSVLGFAFRHAVVGTLLWAAMAAGLPGLWIALGVTAWPFALAYEGLRVLASLRGVIGAPERA